MGAVESVINHPTHECSVKWHRSDHEKYQKGDCKEDVITFLASCTQAELSRECKDVKKCVAAPIAGKKKPSPSICTDKSRLPIHVKQNNTFFCCDPPQTTTIPTEPTHTIARTIKYKDKHFNPESCHLSSPSPHLSKNATILATTEYQHWLHAHCKTKTAKK